MIYTQIISKNNRAVEVSSNGVLAVGPLEYSTGTFQDMDLVDTAYNFHTPTPGKRLVVTGLVVATNRNVGVNGATIILYEAESATSLTVDKTLLQLDMTKNEILPILGLNSILSEGVFLNGKTDDDDGLVTITSYEVSV